MQWGAAVVFVDDPHDHAHDNAWRLTEAWVAVQAAEEEPGLWHDLARRWLGARRPERYVASDGDRISALHQDEIAG